MRDATLAGERVDRHLGAKFAILALTIVCACGQAQQHDDSTPAAPAAAQAAATIGPDGAAGISTPLPMSLQSIAAAARGYEVAEAQGQIEGEPFTKITLSRGGEVVFELLPGPDRRVHAALTRSAKVRGPAGEVIGQSAFGEAPFSEVIYCRTAVMHEDFSFTCSNGENGRFWRAYRLSPTYRGRREPFTGISPDAALAAGLVEMTWIAPRSE